MGMDRSAGDVESVSDRLGFRTAGLRGFSVEHALELIAGAGYSLVEYCMEHPGASSYRGDLCGLRLSAVSYHGKKDGAFARRAGISRAIEKAVELDASVLVLGSPLSAQASWASFLEECVWLLGELPGSLRPAWEPEPGTVLADLTAFGELVASVGDRAGVNLDFGHCFLDGLRPCEAVKRSGGSLVHTHVEDISGRDHVHLLPGEGGFPWIELLPSLAGNGYSGPIVVDLFDLPSSPGDYIANSLKSALREMGVQ